MPTFIGIQKNHALSTVARLLQPSSWIEAMAQRQWKISAFCRWGNWRTEISSLQSNIQLVNLRGKFKLVCLSPDASNTASSFHGYGTWSTGTLEDWALEFLTLHWRKNPLSSFSGTAATLSSRKHICHSPAAPYLSGDSRRPGSQRESPGHVAQF